MRGRSMKGLGTRVTHTVYEIWQGLLSTYIMNRGLRFCCTVILLGHLSIFNVMSVVAEIWIPVGLSMANCTKVLAGSFESNWPSSLVVKASLVINTEEFARRLRDLQHFCYVCTWFLLHAHRDPITNEVNITWLTSTYFVCNTIAVVCPW